jgi:hypothetical protein
MAEEQIPKVDRRGNTILVPIGIGAVFIVLVVLMSLRMESTAPTRPPPPGTTQNK